MRKKITRVRNPEMTVRSAVKVFSAYHDIRRWMTLTLTNWCDQVPIRMIGGLNAGRRDILPVLYNACGA
jgi:hypothetical protein